MTVMANINISLPGPVQGYSSSGSPYTIVKKTCPSCGKNHDVKVYWNHKAGRPIWNSYCSTCSTKYKNGELLTKKYAPRKGKPDKRTEAQKVQYKKPAQKKEPAKLQKQDEAPVKKKYEITAPPPLPPKEVKNISPVKFTESEVAPADKLIVGTDVVQSPDQVMPSTSTGLQEQVKHQPLKVPPRPPELATPKGIAGVANHRLDELTNEISIVRAQNARLHDTIKTTVADNNKRIETLTAEFNKKIASITTQFNMALADLNTGWRAKFEGKSVELANLKAELEKLLEMTSEVISSQSIMKSRWSKYKGSTISQFMHELGQRGCRVLMEDGIPIGMVSPGGKKIPTGKVLDERVAITKSLYNIARYILKRESIIL